MDRFHMSCIKCGATIKKRPVRYVASSTSNLNQTATVQFRKKVSTTINGTVTTFFPSQIVKLDFSIIYDLLTDDCQVLMFLVRTERIEFELTFPNLEC